MWERIKFWLTGSKRCSGCCLSCPYYQECKRDVYFEGEERDENEEREAYERDLSFETKVIVRNNDQKYRCYIF